MDDVRPLPKYELTIGELFPCNDRASRWVFSVTCLVQDLWVLTSLFDRRGLVRRPGHGEAIDLTATIFHQRTLVARLYEAWRLIKALDDHADLAAYVGGSTSGFGIDLRHMYARDGGKPSEIEQLYEQTRHRAVHYSRIDSLELSDVLLEHQYLPARMVTHRSDTEIPVIEYQWVTATRVQDAVGSFRQEDFLKKLDERSAVTAAVTAAWSMCAAVMVLVHARHRGIAIERLSSDPDGVLSERQAAAFAKKERQARTEPIEDADTPASQGVPPDASNEH